MNKHKLELQIQDGMTTRQIAEIESKSQTTVSYWIKKHSIDNSTRNNGVCKCGESNPENFYGHHKTVCKKCHNEYTKDKGRENKLFGIEILGGKCVHCEYNKSPAALEFHHINPKDKDQNFTTIRGWGKERLRKELSKCILLCANCHREEHERLNIVP